MKIMIAIMAVIAIASTGIAQTKNAPVRAPSTKPTDYTLKEGVPNIIKELWDQRVSLVKEQIKEIQSDIKYFQMDLANRQKGAIKKGHGKTYTFDSSTDKQKSIVEANEILKKLREQLAKYHYYPIATPDFQKFQAGYAGSVDGFKIKQVIDSHNVIVEVKNINMQFATDFWLSGVNTEGLTDDSYVSDRLDFYQSGTQSYTTAIGASRTIAKLSRLNWDDFIEVLKEKS